MAIILHFVYLVVFLLMFVQGMNLAITVIKPLRKQRFGWQMVVAAYGMNGFVIKHLVRVLLTTVNSRYHKAEVLSNLLISQSKFSGTRKFTLRYQ